MKKKVFTTVLLLFVVLNIISCAPGELTVSEPGFFTGLWHGFTIFYSLILSFFDSSISLLAENNSGFLYYLGLVIGIIIIIPTELIFFYVLFSFLYFLFSFIFD